MKNKSLKLVFLGSILSLLLFFAVEAKAAIVPVTGYAWSDTIGWIQMNPEFGGVMLDNETGKMSDYAWSSNVGWINFDGVKIDMANGQVSGFAIAAAVDGSWDGKISFRGTSPDYGVNLDKNTGKFSGFAWGSDVVGWIKVDVGTSAMSIDPDDIVPVNGPDLVAGAVSPGTAVVNVDQSFTSTISNTGNASTGVGFNYFFQVASAINGGGTVIDKTATAMTTLVAGGTGTASVTHKFTSIGNYSIRACADKSNKDDVNGVIVEPSHEDNNCSSWTTVAVSASGGGAVVSISASPNSVNYGSASTLNWSYTNASNNSCTITGQPKPTIYPSGNGSAPTANLTNSTNFIISCFPMGPNSSATVLVTVINIPPGLNPSLNVIKSGQGTVIGVSNPVQSNIACDASCSSQSKQYTSGTVVNLTPTPAVGRIFTGWGGACSGIGVCSVTVDSNKTVNVNFAVDPDYKEF